MKKIFLLILLLIPTQLIAAVIGLEVWDAGSAYPKFIMPKLDNIRSVELHSRYIRSFNQSHTYQSLHDGNYNRPMGEVFNLESIPKDKVLAGLVANNPAQMHIETPSLNTTLIELKLAGANPHIIPLGIETMLTSQELKVFHKKIAELIPLLVLLGGSDVHPSLYGEKTTYSIETNLERDKVELALIRAFITREKGILTGFCRGQQITAVALGHSLFQDIGYEPTFSNKVKHAYSLSDANDRGTRNIFHKINIEKDSLLHRATGKTRITVNSRHHQAIRQTPNNKTTKIVATEGKHKLIEAIEFSNGKGYTFQFHPEDMQTEDSRKILKEIINNAQQVYSTGRKQFLSLCLKKLFI